MSTFILLLQNLKPNSFMPEEHYLAPMIRAFLTTPAGARLLEDPVDHPADSLYKIPRHYLTGSRIKYDAARLESSESHISRATPLEKKTFYSTKQPLVAHGSIEQHINPSSPKQSISKYRRPCSTSHPVPHTNANYQSPSTQQGTFTIFTPLLPPPRKKSTTSKPSQLNKSRVLKNDACPASLAATQNPAAPIRSTDSTHNIRSHRSRELPSF